MPIIAIILLIISIATAVLAYNVVYNERIRTPLGIVVSRTDLLRTILYKLAFGIVSALCLWGAGVLSGWWVL